MNPADLTQPLDPNADLTQPLNPNADLTQPLNPNAPPAGVGTPNLPPILDPNAPIVNPTAPIPGVPQGELPPLLRHSARNGQTAMRTPPAFEDKPQMQPLPHRLGEKRTQSIAGSEQIDHQTATTKFQKDVWWFGPVNNSSGGKKDRKNTNNSKNTKLKPGNWGFD